MNFKKIDNFYQTLAASKQFNEGLKDRLHRIKDEKEYKTFIKNDLLPLAKSMGYDFSVDDILAYERQKLQMLGEEELESVTGGKDLMRNLTTTFISMLALAGGAYALQAMNSAQATVTKDTATIQTDKKSTDKTKKETKKAAMPVKMDEQGQIKEQIKKEKTVDEKVYNAKESEKLQVKEVTLDIKSIKEKINTNLGAAKNTEVDSETFAGYVLPILCSENSDAKRFVIKWSTADRDKYLENLTNFYKRTEFSNTLDIFRYVQTAEHNGKEMCFELTDAKEVTLESIEEKIKNRLGVDKNTKVEPETFAGYVLPILCNAYETANRFVIKWSTADRDKYLEILTNFYKRTEFSNTLDIFKYNGTDGAYQGKEMCFELTDSAESIKPATDVNIEKDSNVVKVGGLRLTAGEKLVKDKDYKFGKNKLGIDCLTISTDTPITLSNVDQGEAVQCQLAFKDAKSYNVTLDGVNIDMLKGVDEVDYVGGHDVIDPQSKGKLTLTIKAKNKMKGAYISRSDCTKNLHPHIQGDGELELEGAALIDGKLDIDWTLEKEKRCGKLTGDQVENYHFNAKIKCGKITSGKFDNLVDIKAVKVDQNLVEGKDYLFDKSTQVLTIKTDVPLIIESRLNELKGIVVAKDVNADITLKNVKINTEGKRAPFKIEDGSTGKVTLRVEGGNSELVCQTVGQDICSPHVNDEEDNFFEDFKCAIEDGKDSREFLRESAFAGIEKVGDKGSLTIEIAQDGQLTVCGYGRGAGIGGAEDNHVNDITIITNEHPNKRLGGIDIYSGCMGVPIRGTNLKIINKKNSDGKVVLVNYCTNVFECAKKYFEEVCEDADKKIKETMLSTIKDMSVLAGDNKSKQVKVIFDNIEYEGTISMYDSSRGESFKYETKPSIKKQPVSVVKSTGEARKEKDSHAVEVGGLRLTAGKKLVKDKDYKFGKNKLGIDCLTISTDTPINLSNVNQKESVQCQLAFEGAKSYNVTLDGVNIDMLKTVVSGSKTYDQAYSVFKGIERDQENEKALTLTIKDGTENKMKGAYILASGIKQGLHIKGNGTLELEGRILLAGFLGHHWTLVNESRCGKLIGDEVQVDKKTKYYQAVIKNGKLEKGYVEPLFDIKATDGTSKLTEGKDYAFDAKALVLTVKTATPLIITGVDKINGICNGIKGIEVAKDVNADITLKKVQINTDGERAPFKIEDGSEGHVTLRVAGGESKLLCQNTTAYDCFDKDEVSYQRDDFFGDYSNGNFKDKRVGFAGIEKVGAQGSLMIEMQQDGYLTVSGYGRGAGIGGVGDDPVNNITIVVCGNKGIHGGSINVYSGCLGVPIYGNNITIKGEEGTAKPQKGGLGWHRPKNNIGRVAIYYCPDVIKAAKKYESYDSDDLKEATIKAIEELNPSIKSDKKEEVEALFDTMKKEGRCLRILDWGTDEDIFIKNEIKLD